MIDGFTKPWGFYFVAVPRSVEGIDIHYVVQLLAVTLKDYNGCVRMPKIGELLTMIERPIVTKMEGVMAGLLGYSDEFS